MAQPGEHYRIRDEVRSVDLASIEDAAHRWRQLGREVAEIRDDLDRARKALMDPSGGWNGDGAERFSESIDAARTTAGRVAATAIEGIVDGTGSAFENSDPDRNMVHQLSQLREDVEFLRQDRVCPSPLPDKPWHDYPTWTWGESHKYAGPFEWGHKYRVKRNGEVIREYSPQEAQQAAWAIGAPSPDGLSGEQIDRLLEYLGFNDAEYRTTVQTHGDVSSRFTEAANSLPAMPRRTPWDEFAGGEYPSGGGGSPGGGGSTGGSPGGGATPPAPGSAPSGSPTGPLPNGHPGDGTGTGDPGQYETGVDSTGTSGDIGGNGGSGDGGSDGTIGGSTGGSTGGSDGTGNQQGGGVGGNGTGQQPAATGGELWDEDDWAGAGVAAAGGVGGPGSSLAGIGGGSGGVPSTAGATNPGGLAVGAGGTGAGAAAGSGGGAAGSGGVGAAGRGPTGGVAGSPGTAGAGGAAGRGGVAPMMPRGAGGAGGGDGDERATWLEEDRDVWGLDDDTTPPPVIE